MSDETEGRISYNARFGSYQFSPSCISSAVRMVHVEGGERQQTPPMIKLSASSHRERKMKTYLLTHTFAYVVLAYVKCYCSLVLLGFWRSANYLRMPIRISLLQAAGAGIRIEQHSCIWAVAQAHLPNLGPLDYLLTTVSTASQM